MRTLLCIWLLASLVGNSSVLCQTVDRQTSPDDRWTAVTALVAGTRVRIEQHSNVAVEGRVVSADDQRISVTAGSRAIDVTRPAIRRIVSRTGTSVGRGALIGLLIGAGGGAIQGATTTESDKGWFIAYFAAGWAAIGAGIGALIAAGNRH